MSDEPKKSAMKDDSQVDTSAERTTEKPRARLGPMEVVILPGSDSEDEDDDDDEKDEDGTAKVEEMGPDGEPEDFLRTYPADTEVNPEDVFISHERRRKPLTTGPSTSTPPPEIGTAYSAEIQSIRPKFEKTMSEAE
jgi:hypothetical protein